MMKIDEETKEGPSGAVPFGWFYVLVAWDGCEFMDSLRSTFRLG